VILAIDPGTSKVGWAIVDNSGKAVDQGIAILDRGLDQLRELVDLGAIRTVVLGDGTNRVNIEAEIRRLHPQVAVVVVDETASTVDAWRLKRKEEAGRSLFRQLWLTLVQLFSPPPVDDYAARVLARRYLERRQPGA
jgi:RNase H-fold protein (predicted Holliday junction resolvase)